MIITDDTIAQRFFFCYFGAIFLYNMYTHTHTYTLYTYTYICV